MSKTTKIYSDRLEHLIEVYASDGVVTEKERSAIIKAAADEGINTDEVEAYLDQKAKDVSSSKRTKVMTLVVLCILLVGGAFGWFYLQGSNSDSVISGFLGNAPEKTGNESVLDSRDVKKRIASENEIKQAIKKQPILYTISAVSQVAVSSRDAGLLGSLKNIFGEKQIVVSISANLKAGIDLSLISNVRIQGDSISLTLPHPFIKMESSSIDRVITGVTGARNEFTGFQQDEIIKVGEYRIKDNLDKFDLVNPTVDRAQTILTSLLKNLGFNEVTIYSAQNYYSKDQLIKLVRK